MNLKLVRKRTVWLPTWRGWLLLCLAVAVVVGAGVRSIHPFLATSQPVPANTLVVDGWMPDDALKAALAEYRRTAYEHLCATGGPLTRGTYLSKYHNYAELTAASLNRMGLGNAHLVVAPSAGVSTNRTYESALAVKRALDRQALRVDGMNLFTLGCHARRSRMVYRKVFGPQVRVGVISYPSADYDPVRWWTSSAGLKGVIGETLSWAYEWLLDSGRAADASSSPPGPLVSVARRRWPQPRQTQDRRGSIG